MLNAPINSQIGSYQLTVNSKSAALYYSLIIPNKLQSKNPQDIKRSTLKKLLRIIKEISRHGLTKVINKGVGTREEFIYFMQN